MLFWHVRYVLDLVEWRHIAALGLLSFLALTLFCVDYPLYRETRALSFQVTASRARSATNDNSKASSTDQKPRDTATEFVASLPAYETYPRQLSTLTELAEKNGIAILRIAYRYEPVPELPIRKLTLNMDLSGSEAQLRGLLSTMLNSVPNLAIARLAYTKAVDPGASVEQRLDISLYYRLDKATA
jgi:hypothetical protein